MKKSGLIIACFLFLSASLFAQERKRISPEERAKLRSERIAEQLELSQEQKAQVYALNLKEAEAGKKAREERKQKVIAMRDSRRNYQKALEEILTPEQAKKWEELKAQRRDEIKKRYKRRPGMYKKPVQGPEVKSNQPDVKG